MSRVVFLLEEPSMRTLLEGLLRRLFPCLPVPPLVVAGPVVNLLSCRETVAAAVVVAAAAVGWV